VSICGIPSITVSPGPTHVRRTPRALPTRRRREIDFRWLNRPRRVLLTLAAVWVINVFDLGYTLLEAQYAGFIEVNPVAARLIDAAPGVLISYKAALMLASSTILLLCRRHRIVELGCWFLLAVHFQLAVRWWWYFEERLTAFDDPATNIHPLIG
jgi:hypothetical protein